MIHDVYNALYMLEILKKSCLLLVLLLVCCPGGKRPDFNGRFGAESGKESPEISRADNFFEESEKELEQNAEEPQSKASSDLSGVENRTENLNGSGFNPEGPPGAEGQIPPADKNLANLVTAKYDTSNKIYSGYGELKVDVVEEVKKQITKIAEASGGYVEDVYEDSITVRVPARQFSELFKQILLLGEVLNKSIETIDVTEYYTDLKARLQVSQKTRARLYALLARTQDVKEQLEILKEIKRLTEEIERINLELKLVENQIRYSCITIRLIPRIAQGVLEQKKIPFDWIANLNPLFPSLSLLEGAVEMKLEDDFAVFNQETIFRAESADGVRVRVGTTKNTPKGDTDFWQRALSFHLKKFYQETKPYDGNLVQGVLLKSKDAKPFYYLIGVAARENKIFVIEVFFPDESVFNQRYGGITGSLKDLKIK